jgi:myo-inositol 2-dehydrogenase / D-chiro-inositol 1-dehydrogenase
LGETVVAAQGNREVGIGIIGAGKMGRVHASNLARGIANAKLVAVSDVVEDSAKRLGAEFGVTNIFADYLRLVENREVQAIVIATPTILKPQIVRAACEVGKHIFCEKPLASTYHEAEQALRWTQKSPAKFQTGHQRRFDPHHVRIKEKVESGEIGNIVLVKSSTRDPSPNPAQWPDLKSSGGIFFDSCSDDYDLVRWLCGSEVSRVEAEGSPRSQPDQHTAITNLSMANGVVAQVEASRMSSYGYDVRVEVLGTKGAVFTRPDAASDLRVVKGSQEAVATYGSYLDRFKEAYRLEMESFIDSVVKDADTKATAQDGKAAVEIAAAARKSMQEGKAVNLPL